MLPRMWNEVVGYAPLTHPTHCSARCSSLILQHVHAGVPVGDEHQPVGPDISVTGLGCERDVRAGVDELFRWRRHPVRDLLRREGVLDVEHPDAGIVVSRENRLLALERARAVLVQIMRAEGAIHTEI